MSLTKRSEHDDMLRSVVQRSGYESYFEYSTCAGAGVVGISLKVGSGRIGGADESLVQQPQDVKRIAIEPTEMVNSNRVIRFGLMEDFIAWERIVIKRIKRKPRPLPGKRAGREP